MSEKLQIPVELEVEAVKRYVMGETLTHYNFDLLQNYFEGRIIELLDGKHNATNGDLVHNESGNCTVCVAIALIKGDDK